MNKRYKLSALWIVCLMLLSCFAFTACDEDDLDTNPYKGGISLNVFGPSPVARGGELRFLGCGLDQVTAVVIPGCENITDITVISSEEIRVTVPQTAEPGYVTLIFQNGESITTKTKLTYSEPISVESFSPEIVKPGDVLTIQGEYLNLIHQVIFADNVIVSDGIMVEEDTGETQSDRTADKFLKHTRNEIQVLVPEEAKTGKIILSDGAEIPNQLYSEQELQVILPTVNGVIDLKGKKPGEQVTVTGKDLDLVREIRMPNGDTVDFVYSSENESITFMLPATITNGTVYALPASGVEIEIARLEVAMPDKVTVIPASGVRAGQKLTLNGENMELITTVVFPGVTEAVQPLSSSSEEVVVVVPERTVSGELILNTGSGATVTVFIETAKPANLSCGQGVKAGEKAIIHGENLDLVSAVVFANGLEGTILSKSETELVVSVPAQAESGIVTLKMENGEEVSELDLTIDVPAACYIVNSLDGEYHAGEVVTFEVANGDKLTEIRIDGVTVQYILSGNQLMIQIPGTAGKDTSVELVSAETVINYSISFIPTERPETVIWEGTFTTTSSWEGNQDLGWNGYDWSSVEPGTVITVYYTLNTATTDWQLRLGGCGIGWAALPTIPAVSLEAGSTSFSATLTAEDLAVLSDGNNSGLVVTGCNFTMTKITLK